ncbi:MAG TPA: DUF2231 domain-containing protein [Blastocatellia bacterium]|nr:DUF2231 domain-containing protein [Blastocatellia bacterium]
MESRAKLFGHPIHPMLIVFPLGLLATSVGFDIAYLVTDDRYWAGIAYYLLGIGIATGLIAAVFGLIDWLAIPSGTRAKRIGALHGIGNVVVVGLFLVSCLMRWSTVPDSPSMAAIVLSWLGVGLALITGWMGGELVDRLAVGVDEGAHLNSPSSLSGRPAHEDTIRPEVPPTETRRVA